MRALNLVLTILFHSLRALGRSRSDLLLENLALRQPIVLLTKKMGRPRLDAEARQLIDRLAYENPTWGAHRIHGDLSKLGLDVSGRTVSWYLPRIRPGRGTIRAWGTFLRNHRDGLAAVDFFTFPP